MRKNREIHIAYYNGYNYFDMEWYSTVCESGKPTWLSPFLEYVVTTDYRTLMTTYSYPVKDRNGEFIGCGRCFISCNDGGHQAITFNPETRRPSILGKRCVGCHLCMLICPVGAISAGVRIPKPTP